MPRKKQELPKKHDAGTDSIMVQVETTDQQDVQLPLDCTNKTKSPSVNQESTDVSQDGDSALDLSVRKRRLSNEDQDIQRSSTKKSSHVDLEKPNFPPMSSIPVLNLIGDGFMGSTSNQSTPFMPLYVPPFRFPPFPNACPPLSSPTTSSRNGDSSSQADSLSKLSSLVHQVGKGQKPGPMVATSSKVGSNGQMPVTEDGRNSLQEALGAAAGHGLSFQELWLRFVKKEENAELKRLNEAKQIFTCLQCQASFQTMEQLVKHMETTQHYANIPKHYSWSLQYARQRMRQMKMKMKYSDKMMYYCFLCTAPFTEPVHVHFNCAHNMHNPVENMKFVHVISVNGKNNSDRTASTASASSIHRTGAHSTTPHSTNGDQRRRRRSNEDDMGFSSSPLSMGASSCESASVSPTPSTASKRSTNTCPVTSFSPNSNQTESGSYSDNLLLKMEKLVQSAASDKNERRRSTNATADLANDS